MKIFNIIEIDYKYVIDREALSWIVREAVGHAIPGVMRVVRACLWYYNMKEQPLIETVPGRYESPPSNTF